MGRGWHPAGASPRDYHTAPRGRARRRAWPFTEGCPRCHTVGLFQIDETPHESLPARSSTTCPLSPHTEADLWDG
jgi:hypothetical protein